jgi:hypothetical protein
VHVVQDSRILFLLDTVGSDNLRQMSEYPILYGEQYHPCILRRWRPVFLHPKEEIQSLIDLPQG